MEGRRLQHGAALKLKREARALDAGDPALAAGEEREGSVRLDPRAADAPAEVLEPRAGRVDGDLSSDAAAILPRPRREVGGANDVHAELDTSRKKTSAQHIALASYPCYESSLHESQLKRGFLPMAYRRKKGSDVWHWCTNCSNWPGNPYDEHGLPTKEGERRLALVHELQQLAW
jgi:hypothetical protein